MACKRSPVRSVQGGGEQEGGEQGGVSREGVSREGMSREGVSREGVSREGVSREGVTCAWCPHSQTALPGGRPLSWEWSTGGWGS